MWEGDSGRESEDGTSEEHSASRAARMEMPIELDLDDDDDLDEALDGAPERDLVDLAGILGEFNHGISTLDKSLCFCRRQQGIIATH